MDENQLLQQLINQAKSHPDCSAQRRIALTKLISKIRQSPSLKKPNNSFNIPNYIDVYNEVLNEVCMEICRKIDSYDHERPVMAWVNNIFNYRSIDAYNRDRRRGMTNIPKDERPSWIELDRPLNSNDTENMYTQISTPHIHDDENTLLKELIQTDPDGVFSSRHIQSRPDVTFQKIALMRLEGEQWDEISEKLKTISIATLSSFYRRSIDHFLDYIRKELKY
jgi:DNA-directed RNA polymerase specialized sigma24 family protein